MILLDTNVVIAFLNGNKEVLKRIQDLGFSERIKGDHHIFYKEGIEEIINLQPLRGSA